jgi:hypothetical protein
MSKDKMSLFVPVICAFLCMPDTIFAQSCAMCYTSAAASGDAGTKALQHGIEILMFPPLLIFVGIFVAAFRRSRSGRL